MSDAQRRLAAIVAIDVVGYSRLMGRDEQGTLARLKDHRAATDPIGDRHGGRIVGTAGDGLLIEFPSVVEAVTAAIEVQTVMTARNADLPDDDKMLYRIGINLGDVLVDGDDIYGDGVNVAARLEALAEPGGICVSRTVRDNVRDKMEVAFDDLGEVEVKNIARPVRAFRVALDEAKGAPRPGRPGRARLLVPVSAAAAVLIIAFVGVAFWYTGWLLPAAQDTARPDSALALPTGPKIVVLPFDNLSGDAAQDYFVDGLTEDVTTRLSRYFYLFVIARNSAYQYKGKAVDVREVGRDLGVDYVLEGSVRRSGGTIRMSAQLLNAKDGTHVWAETYDRALDVDGVFDMQDELSSSVAQAIGGFGGAVRQPILQQLKDKRPSDLASYECVLLAWYFWETYRPDIHQRAQDCLESVVTQEPHYARAWAYLSGTYRAEAAEFGSMSLESLQKAKQAAQRAIEEDPNLPFGHSTIAWAQFFLRNGEEARLSAERAIALAPSEANHLWIAGALLIRLGYWDRGKALNDKALKLNPYPSANYFWTPIQWHYWRGEYEQALEQVLKVKRNLAGYYGTHMMEAMVLAELDRVDEAEAAIDRAVALKPDLAATVEAEGEFWWWPQPDFIERMRSSLLKAGLDIPEQSVTAK